MIYDFCETGPLTLKWPRIFPTVDGHLDYSVAQFVFLSKNLYFTRVNILQALKPTSK